MREEEGGKDAARMRRGGGRARCGIEREKVSGREMERSQEKLLEEPSTLGEGSAITLVDVPAKHPIRRIRVAGVRRNRPQRFVKVDDVPFGCAG
jgi:hypothetical protein